MNINKDVKIQRSEQQLPSLSSDEKKALATYENKQYVRDVGGETKVPHQYKPSFLSWLILLGDKETWWTSIIQLDCFSKLSF